MKRFKGKQLFLLIVIFSLLLVSACSNKTNEEEAADTSIPEGPVDTWEKYEEPVTVSIARPIDSSIKFIDGESWENNTYTQAYNEEFNMELKYEFMVNSDQYSEKMNVAIASGDLPDIMTVDGSQLKQLVESDLVEDLTDYYDKYATPLLKEVLNSDGGVGLKNGTFDGKIMAISNTVDVTPNTLMYIRQDWLDNLGLEAPKTLQDVFAIAEAFTFDDPDGNGKDDTFGIGLEKYLFGGLFDADGIANGFHAYPKIWIEDDNGQLGYGSIQPEMKPFLAKLQELFKKGVIDKEFSVKDGGTVGQDAAAGKVGIDFGANWNPIWPLVDTLRNNPEAIWKAYPIMSIDDEPAKPQINPSVNKYYVVKKGAKHPEAIFKIANHYVRTHSDDSRSDEQKLEDFNKFQETYIDGVKYETFKFAPIQEINDQQNGNLQFYREINEALKNDDPSGLSIVAKENMKQVKAWIDNKDINSWGMASVFGPESSLNVIDENYVKNDLVMTNAFTGLATPTQVRKGTILNDKELEVFTKIIMGEPVDETFDKFVEDWKKLGGEDLTKEVNEWYEKNK